MSKPWFEKARALERADRLDEAEAIIRDGVPDAHFALVIADLYRHRMFRLRESGDVEGAGNAREHAERWACFFASQATSGGEGMAYSGERDEFLKSLGP